jgi:methionyl-tRNA formyltransferase
MSDKQAIGIITADEILILPIYIDRILRELSSDVTFVAIVNLSTSSTFADLRQYVSSYGLSFTWSVVWRTAFKKALAMVGLSDTVADVCRRRGVHSFAAGNVNDREFVRQVAESGVGIIVSVGCPQIYRKHFIANCGARLLNVHSSLLPEYRGLNAPFWCLRYGEARTGVTVHTIEDERIDRGTIIAQVEVPIVQHDSYFDLAKRIATLGPEAVARAIDLVKRDTVPKATTGGRGGTYFRWPSREDVRAFKAAGHRFFKRFQL